MTADFVSGWFLIVSVLVSVSVLVDWAGCC